MEIFSVLNGVVILSAYICQSTADELFMQIYLNKVDLKSKSTQFRL